MRQLLANDATLLQGAEAVAQRLHLSARTLHRQLQQEGASLQRIKDEVRQQHAKHLLQYSSRSVKQVATATGFRNDKSFIRAFRGWTGLTPSEFRLRVRTAPLAAGVSQPSPPDEAANG